MIRCLFIASMAALLACGPVAAHEHSRKKAHAAKKEKAKVEAGASCKAPAVATCAACNITCRPGEAATCVGGQVSGDQCVVQPSCRCR
jgi:hypothetical protein